MRFSTPLLTFVAVAASCMLTTNSYAEKHHDAHSHDHASTSEVPTEAVCVLNAFGDSGVSGTLVIVQKGENLHVTGTVKGLTPGQHGFHIHQYGDLRDPEGKSAGGHYNPDNTPHGGPDDEHRHAGDLGNIEADQNGVAKVNKMAKGLKLHFIIGRSFVVHGGVDDLKSQPSGAAGPRVAIGVIGFAEVKD